VSSPTKKVTPLLACEGIVKNFGGVRALRGVDFSVRAGRVHALVGENGAGKSTLAKIIAGLYPPDAGRLLLDGQPLALSGTREALKRGIVTVHQDINLIPSQTVAENIFLANEPASRLFGVIRQGELHARTAALLERYGIGCRPGTLVADLPNDQKKMVQILKAISREARILLLDEPTSSLTDAELRLVLRLIRELAEQGVGIVFISHYLGEVFEVANDITVLRDGAMALSANRQATSIGDVVAAMIGRELAPEAQGRREAAPGKPLLEVRDLSVRNGPAGVSFTLHEGEVLGITGLTGSGLTELAKAIFASPDVRRDGGEIRLHGEPLHARTPRDSLAAGIALLTNDRLREGILPESPIYENVALPVLGRFGNRFGVLDLAAMRDAGARAIQRLRIRAPGPASPAKSLSGGNQQKVLLAKWLGTHPRVFIMDEPTIGIDVGSKAEIREQVRQIARRGVGVILITAEIDELTTLCDRVLIMFRGRVVAELAGGAINRQTILQTSVSGELAA
jgi:ABC-type sugar transport system ATPase subunit